LGLFRASGPGSGPFMSVLGALWAAFSGPFGGVVFGCFWVPFVVGSAGFLALRAPTPRFRLYSKVALGPLFRPVPGPILAAFGLLLGPMFPASRGPRDLRKRSAFSRLLYSWFWGLRPQTGPTALGPQKRVFLGWFWGSFSASFWPLFHGFPASGQKPVSPPPWLGRRLRGPNRAPFGVGFGAPGRLPGFWLSQGLGFGLFSRVLACFSAPFGRFRGLRAPTPGFWLYSKVVLGPLAPFSALFLGPCGPEE